MNKEFKYALYKVLDEDLSVNAIVKDETIWLTQKAMAELFNIDRSVIAKHIKNIYLDEELSEVATCAKFAQVQKEGDREINRKIDFYNLDVIISVGYRVNSKKATQFRIWATGVLNEYMRKEFALDDERLKYGEEIFGEDYFHELLECIRSIRTSERRIWQQITDIFAECSYDYDKTSDEARIFYATI